MGLIGCGAEAVQHYSRRRHPQLFSSFQFIAVGFVLLLITVVVRGQTTGASSKLVAGWAFVTFMFFFLGLDDGTKLHERLGTMFNDAVTNSADEGTGPLGTLNDWFPSYSWQVIVGPFYVAAGLFLIFFLSKQLDDPRLLGLVTLAVALFAVAQVMDFLEGRDDDLFLHVADFFSTFEGRAVHFSKSVEEFFEMAGTTTFLYIFLKKLSSLTPSLSFQLRPGGST